MDEKRQVQKELFEEFAAPQKKRHFKALFSAEPKRMVGVLFEHLILISIIFIILTVASFLLGVQRGKALVSRVLISPVAGKEQRAVPTPEARKTTKPELSERITEKEPAPLQQQAAKPKEEITGWTLQIASYSKKAEAEKALSRLKDKGLRAFMMTSGKYYIICIGDFKTRQEASEQAKRLSRQYPGCMPKKK